MSAIGLLFGRLDQMVRETIAQGEFRHFACCCHWQFIDDHHIVGYPIYPPSLTVTGGRKCVRVGSLDDTGATGWLASPY
jgi:hypothetical protein